jgi:hypothetical protein
MTFAPKDRVKDTTTTTGTGTITLAGSPPTTFQAFSAVGNGNTCPYTIVDNATGAWESGIGTYTSSGTTLSRDTVLASSNAGSLVNFAAGSKDVFISLPAALVGYQQIGTTQTPSGVASSSITGIPAIYSDLLLVAIGLSHDSGSNQTLRVEYSGDGGGSYTAPQNIQTVTQAASTAIYGSILIPGYLMPAGPLGLGQFGSLSSDVTTSNAGSPNTARRLDAGINAIRLSWSAGNFDAGLWKLFGRL